MSVMARLCFACACMYQYIYNVLMTLKLGCELPTLNTFKNILFTVDCGSPGVLQRGSLENYTDTTEGLEVFYRCDPGLVPEGRMRAVCTRNGWSPNPADLCCTVGMYNHYLHD